MAANINPIFTLTPKIGIGQISVANPNLDGSGDLVTIISGGINGTRITKVTIKAIVTTTAGMVRLFISNGTTTYLWLEVAVSAITKSATVAAFSYTAAYTGELSIVLPDGYSILASTEKAETFNVIIEGGDY